MNTPDLHEYDVALSFAGEDRRYVARVARLLTDAQVRVFYDAYEKATLWGKDLYTHLVDVYKNRARYTVLFASKAYADKVWTNHERTSAQARAITEREEYILPARFDDSEIPGLLSTTGYIDLRGTSPEQLVELILEKLGREKPSWERVEADSLPGEPSPRGQSLRGLAAQLSSAAHEREALRRFMGSEAGVEAGNQAARDLFSSIEAEIAALREVDRHLNIHFEVSRDKVLLVRTGKASFTMYWGVQYGNTLDGASLFAQEFDGGYYLGSGHREPATTEHWLIAISERAPATWTSMSEKGMPLTSGQLADRYLSRVIRCVYDDAHDAPDW